MHEYEAKYSTSITPMPETSETIIWKSYLGTGKSAVICNPITRSPPKTNQTMIDTIVC